MVLGFPLGGASEPAWTLELGESCRAGPVNGVITAESPDGRLSATSVQDRTSVELLGPGPAFTRIDMIGAGVLRRSGGRDTLWCRYCQRGCSRAAATRITCQRLDHGSD